jgi:hypothetical protein
MIRKHPRQVRILGPADFALSLVAIAGCALLMFGCDSESHAAPVCRPGVPCAVVKRVAAPVYQQAVVASPVYYQVGGHLQQQAASTVAFRHSEEYAEYLELKGFERHALLVAGQQASQMQRWEEAMARYEAAETPGATPPEPPAQEPTAHPAQQPLPAPTPAEEPTLSAVAPMVAALCMKCHTGEEPPAGLTLDGTRYITPLQLRASLVAIRDGAMPKNHEPLDAATRLAIYEELPEFTEQ